MAKTKQSDKAGRPCDCRDGDECYGDYPPAGVKCRDLEQSDPGIDPVGAADDQPQEPQDG